MQSIDFMSNAVMNEIECYRNFLSAFVKDKKPKIDRIFNERTKEEINN